MLRKETVVQTASLLHGLRRALSPETRNRIWFEMRREVKRSRKQRRAELRAGTPASGRPGSEPGMASDDRDAA